MSEHKHHFVGLSICLSSSRSQYSSYIILEPSSVRFTREVIIAIKRGLARDGESHLQLFEVTGEDTIIGVFQKKALICVKKCLREACAQQVRLKCTPIRAYENFARMIGVTDEKLLTPQRDLTGVGQIYWLHAKVEYKGFEILQELFRRWKIEAETSLRARLEGKCKMDLYKCVFQREVHCFVSVANGDALDDMAIAFPMHSEMGDQIQVTCKGVEIL